MQPAPEGELTVVTRHADPPRTHSFEIVDGVPHLPADADPECQDATQGALAALGILPSVS